MKIGVLLFVLLVGLALAGCHRSGGYSATAKIEVIRPVYFGIGSDTPGESIAASEWPSPRGVQREFRMMESPNVLSPIITDLQLDRIWAKRLNRGEILPMQDALNYFSSRLKLENEAGTNIVSITATADDPKEATDMANAVVNRYKTMRDVLEEQMRNSGIAVLHDNIAQQEKILEDAQVKATQNPTNTDLQEKRDVARIMLHALKTKLSEVISSSQPHQSPVKILSLADPPKENW